MYDLYNFKATRKGPFITEPNPQELPLKALQNGTKHDSILCRVRNLFHKGVYLLNVNALYSMEVQQCGGGYNGG